MAAQNLDILVLGELRVVRDGLPLALPASRKTRALLAYLATTGRPHLRTHLAELLWSDADNPRAALRWSLTKLRPLVGARLVSDRERASLDLRGVLIDLAEVKASLGGAAPAAAPMEALRKAAASFRGDLFEGLDMPDSARFQAWCQAERGESRRLRLAILAALVEREPDAETRLRHARERVALDPYEESAHVDLVSILAKAGRTRDAVDAYEACRRLFERDLGIAPSRRLAVARAEVHLADVARASGGAAPQPPPPSRSGANLPFVGRRPVEIAVRRAVEGAKEAPHATALLFTGPPGIGKTRCLDEIAAAVRTEGGVVLYGRGVEVERVRPYGVWLDALRSAPRGALPPAPREIAALLPEAASDADALVERARVFEVARHWMAEAARRAGVLAIVLDDLHWMDEASAALLSLVARTTPRVVLACGARNEELDENPAALRLVRSLRRERLLVALPLEPLDLADTTALVRALDAATDVARVHAESGGNPLFAIEITRSLARGMSTIPDTLRGIVAERLERLDDETRDALSWAAAFETSFLPELLGVAAGIPEGDLSRVLAELERRGFIQAAREPLAGAYDFVHDLIRRAVYLSIAEPRRRTMHRHVASALAAAPGARRESAVDVAHHAALGGEDALAARHFRFAAERCQALFANAEAIALADRGLHHLTALPREATLATEVALRRVQVCSGAGAARRTELEHGLMRLAREAQRAGAAAEATDALYILSILHHDGGDFPGAAANIVRAAEVSRGASAATRARSLANAGRCLAQIERDMDQADAMLREAEALARHAGLELMEIPWGLAVVRQFAGDYDEAARLFEQALASATDEQNHWPACECLTRLVMIALEQGRFDAALARAEDLAHVASKMGEGSEGPTSDALTALARAAGGRVDGVERIEAAIGALRIVDAKGMLAYTLAFAAELDLDAGRCDAARRHADEALAAARAVGRPTQAAIAAAILARALFAQGRPKDAAATLEAAAGAGVRVSARARALLASSAARVGVSIPGPVQTPVPTVGR